jgi:hypothetical protein
MAAPVQMTKHVLEVLKGRTLIADLTYSAKLSANVTIDPVYAGRVVHLNSVGELEMGLATTHMALFVFERSDDPDVTNDGGDVASDADAFVKVKPTGEIMCFVASGGFELASTEFEPEATAGVYAPNQMLTATASNSSATTGGRLCKGTVSTHNICGVVSSGVNAPISGRSELRFWSVWLPAGV